MESPTQPQGCGGESGSNRALYVAQQHPIARFAERAAAIAQLVEHDLAKVGVASSSLVCRSPKEMSRTDVLLTFSKRNKVIEKCSL